MLDQINILQLIISLILIRSLLDSVFYVARRSCMLITSGSERVKRVQSASPDKAHTNNTGTKQLQLDVK